jgi:ATP-dependent 26S proteasome regulatory subunit
MVISLTVSVQWKSFGSEDSEQTESVKKKRKKAPKKKKAKKKKAKKQDDTKKKELSDKQKEKEKKKKEKRKKQQDKRVAQLHKERDKKNQKIAKEREQAHQVDTECDSTDVTRTSTDTLILKKYIKIYRSLGGICYILHLQDIGTPVKTSDGFYTVMMKQSKDPRAAADWQTYLYCPIGKPDGMVALRSPEGDTVQICSYVAEKKHGMMTYYKKGQGIFYQEKFANDEKVWVSPIEGE